MNIYVGNLSYQLTENELAELFSEFGEVESAKIVMDRETGRSKGFGFIEMTNEEQGDAAINELDGKEVNGRNLKVNKARPREERPRYNNNRRPRY